MTTITIKQTAFAKFLRQTPREHALSHLYQCLARGPSEDNMAWELWKEVHGDRTFPSSEIPSALGVMLDSLGDE